MGTTSTTNYNLLKPNPFEEDDTWGPILNSNFDKIDTAIKARADEITALGTSKQNASTILTAFAGLTPLADRLAYFTGASTAAVTPLTALARTLLSGASTAAMQGTLGLGSLATLNSVSLTTNVTGTLPLANGGTGAVDAAGARTALGLGSLATLSSVSLTTNVTGTLPVAQGGTGATDAATARANLGITSPANATTSAAGVVQLATTTEALTGTDAAKAVTPDALAALWEQGTDIASAATLTIGEGGYFVVTGTTTITAITAAGRAGRPFMLRFAGTLTLTNNANIILRGANITTAAGDVAEFRTEAGGVVRLVSYWAAAAASGIAQGTTVATTSGTSVDFTGIPATAKRITILMQGVSTNGTSLVQFQLGTSSGVETSNYMGASSATAGAGTSSGSVNNAGGFAMSFAGAASGANARHGVIHVVNMSGNVWCCIGVFGLSDNVVTSVIGGSKALSGVLDRVRITTVNGTDTFDAGSVNITWES